MPGRRRLARELQGHSNLSLRRWAWFSGSQRIPVNSGWLNMSRVCLVLLPMWRWQSRSILPCHKSTASWKAVVTVFHGFVQRCFPAIFCAHHSLFPAENCARDKLNIPRDLIFFPRLKAGLIQKKLSHSWDISRYTTRKSCITSVYRTCGAWRAVRRGVKRE